MINYLPSIISLAGVVVTVLVSLWLGLAKQRTENTTVKSNIEGTFRDDLIALLDQKEAQLRLRDERLEKRNEQLQAAQTVISAQLEKITDLNLTVKQLEYENKQLKIQLEQFTKKVYYIPKMEKEPE